MPAAPRVIRDKEFAKRLEISCENHHLSPSGHGCQKWLRDQILDKFSVRLSPEAVRKWFAGDARPRPNVMRQIAQVLEVDEAWLSLGLSPAETPREKQRQNALTSGAVNLVAAQIQLAGGNIAFPEDRKEEHDLFAIVRGKQHAVTVRLGNTDKKFRLSVMPHAKTVIAVVPTEDPTVYDFVRVPERLIDEYGYDRGGYTNIEIERGKKGFAVDGKLLPMIRSFDDLDGAVPKKHAS